MGLRDVSKFMSLILRHKPEAIGISLDEHGWANVEELIAGIAKNNEFNMEILEEIVRTDEKQRYSFNEDKTLIRANQGHSIPVDVELEEKEPPELLWHGTGEKYVASKFMGTVLPSSFFKGRFFGTGGTVPNYCYFNCWFTFGKYLFVIKYPQLILN